MHRPILALLLGLLLPVAAASDNPYPEPDDGNPQTDDSKPMLGINMSPVPVPVQRSNNIAHDEGVYVRRTYEGTTATDIGIQRGDVILGINGHNIDSMSAVRDSIFSHRVGDDINVAVLRDGQRMQLGGTLGGWPESIPLNDINAAAEARYRQMQARRLARESEVLDERLARARNRNQADTSGLSADKAPRARSSNVLDQLMAEDNGHALGGALPGVHIPPMMALFSWQAEFSLACADPAGQMVSTDRHADDPAIDRLQTQAPDIDLAYAFTVSSESL